ncbi:hypothetical protein E2P81_ATG11193 [Venturia nashicola]|nr:hypothetical protein E2P81_ATG11193 [Venturia nashicola]
MKSPILFTILTFQAASTLAAPITRQPTKALVTRQRMPYGGNMVADDFKDVVDLFKAIWERSDLTSKPPPTLPGHIGGSPHELDLTPIHQRRDLKEVSAEDLSDKIMEMTKMRPQWRPKSNKPQSPSQNTKRDLIKEPPASLYISEEELNNMLMGMMTMLRPEWTPQQNNLQPQSQPPSQEKEIIERSTIGEEIFEFIDAHPEYENLSADEQEAKYMEVKALHPEWTEDDFAKSGKIYRDCMEGPQPELCDVKFELGILDDGSEE